MEEKVKDLLQFCSEINFGMVSLSDRQKDFCNELNQEIILLCKGLPESTQTDALLFFMKYFRKSFSENLNFFKDYYVPAWSIIFWLIQSCPDDSALERKDIRNTRTAHSMAMSLHFLDDGFKDNELPVTHLALLLRSQSWMTMKNAFTRLARGVDGGQKIVKDFIDDYYASIRSTKEIESLDSYCDLFRKQMATWAIAPVLMSKKITTDEKLSDAILAAYGSFGIAWRLLDDLNDIESDMMECIHSSIYVCLPKEIKALWDKHTEEQIEKKIEHAKIILNYLVENSVIETIMEKIMSELESATSIAHHCGMKGLADEFRCLLKPLRKRQNNL